MMKIWELNNFLVGTNLAWCVGKIIWKSRSKILERSVFSQLAHNTGAMLSSRIHILQNICLMVQTQRIKSTIIRSISRGTVSNLLITTKISSGALKKVAAILLKKASTVTIILWSADVATDFASNVVRKIICLLNVTLLNFGLKKKKMILKILLGLRLIVSHVQSATQISKKTRVACTWPAENVITVFAGYAWQSGNFMDPKPEGTTRARFTKKWKKRMKISKTKKK